MSRLIQATCVAIGGRGVLIQGPPGSGKSSLALALIDRGAMLVGDDGLSVEAQGAVLRAFPPPRIAGLIEVRNVGILTRPVTSFVPIALALRLDPAAPRLPEEPEAVLIEGIELPGLALWPESPVLALRAEAALERWGLSFGAEQSHIGPRP
ncbi:HPr kinase/phosphorylase [Novosphingobium ginsenosidimutans]|uniref:Serine kinase n=1 Tax=Novosphingobium ginsenosidimutans TaxID=1176536 RepID=A0A5B8S7C3_9SPHN|nr:HPr kinase/phosphatase C-terminal domain-containing protein [Novosphingobium ginsenosidimutans]QEA17303.1 serine kinase [Novosphingobium ginsenosidimutans]